VYEEGLFILGDFNALRKDDYSQEEWDKLQEKRAAQDKV